MTKAHKIIIKNKMKTKNIWMKSIFKVIINTINNTKITLGC